MTDDEEGEIGAPHSDVLASEVVSDQPDISTSNATEGETIVVVGPGVIDDDEGEIDAPAAVVCASELCPTNLIFRLAVHGRGGYHRSWSRRD